MSAAATVELPRGAGFFGAFDALAARSDRLRRKLDELDPGPEFDALLRRAFSRALRNRHVLPAAVVRMASRRAGSRPRSPRRPTFRRQLASGRGDPSPSPDLDDADEARPAGVSASPEGGA